MLFKVDLLALPGSEVITDPDTGQKGVFVPMAWNGSFVPGKRGGQFAFISFWMMTNTGKKRCDMIGRHLPPQGWEDRILENPSLRPKRKFAAWGYRGKSVTEEARNDAWERIVGEAPEDD